MLDFLIDSLFRIITSQYIILDLDLGRCFTETNVHGYNIYHNHHMKKLNMKQFTYDLCLLHTINKNDNFEIVELQTNNTLILIDEEFAMIEKKKLRKIKLLIKNRKKLIKIFFIKFNDDHIERKNDDLRFN